LNNYLIHVVASKIPLKSHVDDVEGVFVTRPLTTNKFYEVVEVPETIGFLSMALGEDVRYIEVYIDYLLNVVGHFG